MAKTGWMIATCAVLLWNGTALALSPEHRCNLKRVKAWRTYVSCMENIVAKRSALLQVRPSIYVAFAKCRHRYFSQWAKYQRPAYEGSTCDGSRFTDNGDGTVTDNLTELTWEKKDDAGGIHDMHDEYTWSTGAPNREDGTAFTTFLATLNGSGFGGAHGWRLPTLVELHTIFLDFPCTGASCTCPSSPCVDPALDASTTQDFYWSATTYLRFPDQAWFVRLNDDVEALTIDKTNPLRVRAVRGGL